MPSCNPAWSSVSLSFCSADGLATIPCSVWWENNFQIWISRSDVPITLRNSHIKVLLLSCMVLGIEILSTSSFSGLTGELLSLISNSYPYFNSLNFKTCQMLGNTVSAVFSNVIFPDWLQWLSNINIFSWKIRGSRQSSNGFSALSNLSNFSLKIDYFRLASFPR